MTATGAYGVWDTVEQRYVDEVRRELADVPRRQRKELVAVVAADLAERPDSESWEHLLAEVGPPSACAAALRADHGLPAHVGVGGHLRAVRWTAWVVLAIVVVGSVSVGGAWVARDRWASADPGLTNNCSGAGSDGPGTTDHRVQIEEREAAGAYETVISYLDDAEVVLHLGLNAGPGVEVTDVQVAYPPGGLFEQRSVTAADGREPLGEDPVLDAPQPISRAGLRTAIHGRMANCEQYPPGGGMNFGQADVTYRYRGRTHTVPVDLQTQYSFLVRSKEDCPRTRPDG